jgi:hypothetical protein
MRRPLIGTRGTLVITSAIAVALAGGAAYALIPQDNIISACYARATGALRVIDAAVSTCRAGETLLSWNQQGVAGPQGATGPAGPTGPTGPNGADGQPGAAVDLVVGKVKLTTACGTFCSGFRFRPEGYTTPAESTDEEAVDLPIGPGATMSEVTFTLSSPPPAGQTFRVGFTDGEAFHYCEISGTSCSPGGSITFNRMVHGFIDTSYQETTGKVVSFSWKRTF